jgi:hypothetical protein
MDVESLSAKPRLRHDEPPVGLHPEASRGWSFVVSWTAPIVRPERPSCVIGSLVAWLL